MFLGGFSKLGQGVTRGHVTERQSREQTTHVDTARRSCPPPPPGVPTAHDNVHFLSPFPLLPFSLFYFIFCFYYFGARFSPPHLLKLRGGSAFWRRKERGALRTPRRGVVPCQLIIVSVGIIIYVAFFFWVEIILFSLLGM